MTSLAPLKAFIGLGNIGKEFADTYHNAGFLFLDFLAKGAWKEKRGLGFSYQWLGGTPPHQILRVWCGGTLLVKPRGYMNESGRGGLVAGLSFYLQTEGKVRVYL